MVPVLWEELAVGSHVEGGAREMEDVREVFKGWSWVVFG